MNAIDFLSHMTTKRKVYLVGAGPGDPGLLSLRGRECLERADVVLYDGLVNPLLLRYTHAECERTCRTAGPQGKRLPQEEINRHLVEAARAGKTVVRLKGGDPFVFGRGSEEAAALRAAGIEYEIVPGVTAAVAAAEYAGISLTHREHASAVAFVTGHEDPTKPELSIDYANLARFTGTLVFYMGLHRLPLIVDSLISEGKAPNTPACVISRGTLTEQRTVSAPLKDLPDQVSAADLVAPSLIVIGPCVAMREELHWFEDRPLFGVRIAIPRPIPQAYETADLAFEYGAVPLLIPTIAIEPPEDWTEVDRAIADIERNDWLIFTSRNGVSFFFDRFFEQGHDARRLANTKVAVIGSATSAALREYRLHADLVPESFRAEALAKKLSDLVRGKNVLWCGADRGREVLPDELSPLAAEFRKLVVYRNFDVDSWPDDVCSRLKSDDVDWLALSSPSIAEGVARLLPSEAWNLLGNSLRIAAISPVTAEAAKNAGLGVDVVAETYTWPGIFDRISAAVGFDDSHANS